jgi:acyl carrier protein
MTDNQIIADLQNIFRKVFDEPNLHISKETTMEDIAAWDSLHNVMLIDEIESRFNLEFELDDLMDMNDVDAIIKKIISKKA